MKKIFIVLGMHRSATSLTAGILYSYGMYTGKEENLLKANKNNQRGFFENKEIFLLDEAIWCEHGIYSGAYLEKINLFKNTKYENEINGIIKNLFEKSGNKQDIFIKDPRMCVTFPVWKKEIKKYKLEENVIVVFRHPFEVAKSLQKRDNKNFIYALKLWFYYNLSILYCIADCDTPVLILNHEDYFNSQRKQINRLEKFIGYKDNNKVADFIDASLRHNIAESIPETINTEFKDMIFKLYEYLISLSNTNNINVSEKDLKQYGLYLEKMACTSYDDKQEDMSYTYFRDVKGIEKKVWCAYQLYNKKDILILKFKNYFKKYGVTDIYIYGNGTITEALIPVIEKAGITVKKIFDKNQKNYIKDLQNADSETYVLNTVINYGNSVLENLSQYFNLNFIFDIYKILNEFIY